VKTVQRIWIRVLLAVFLLSSCATPATESVEVQDAWSRPAAQGGNGVVYFTVRASAADELIGVASEVAEAAEMHESIMSGDVMEMHQLMSVPLPAGEEVTFDPGGLHIMLVGLKQDLKIGDAFEISLQFSNHEPLRVSVAVKDTPASATNHFASAD
jgi:copper(I)-binding protein